MGNDIVPPTKPFRNGDLSGEQQQIQHINTDL